MTLYNLSISLYILAAVSATGGILLLLLMRKRMLIGAALTFAALLLSLLGSGMYRQAQGAMREAFSGVRTVQFKLGTREDTFFVNLAGADAACLATHVKTQRGRLKRPDGRTLRNSDVLQMSATPAQDLPAVEARQCDFTPREITVAEVPQIQRLP